MRFAPIKLLTDGDMSGSLASIGVDLNQVVLFSIQAAWTGASAAGTLKLQVSNDIVPVASSATNPVGPNPSALVTNWSDYTGSASLVSGPGNFLWNCADVGYRWVRLVYTPSGGTGTLNVTFSGKSV